MPNRHDHFALDALSDALADAAGVHRSAAAVADSPDLADILASRAERLQRMSAEVQECGENDEAGSMLQLLDRLRLAVDHWFGDDDEAHARPAGTRRGSFWPSSTIFRAIRVCPPT